MKFEYVLNPDADYVKKMKTSIKNNDGFCPCKVLKLEQNICPCEDFKITGNCHCNLFIERRLIN